MKTSKLITATIFTGAFVLLTASCEKASFNDKKDPSVFDSIWLDTYNDTIYGPPFDDNYTDSTFGGGTDSTVFGGDLTTGTMYWGGFGGTDTTGWGDSTVFGG